MAQRDSQTLELAIPEPVRTWTAPEEWRAPESLPELTGLNALDFETKDPGLARDTGSSWCYPGEGFICGAAVAWTGGQLYAPINHAAGNMDPMIFWPWLRKQAAKPDVTFIVANAPYEIGWLKRHNIVPANAPIDVQAMAYLLDENRYNYSLESLSREFLGEGKATKQFTEECKRLHIPKPFENMDKVPAWTAASYGQVDVIRTLALYHYFLPLMEKEELINVLNLERESAMVAVDMRMRGVRVDLAKAAAIRQRFEASKLAAIQRIKNATGINISATDNDSIIRALQAENSQVKFGITDKGKTSTAKAVLQRIGSPVAKDVLIARKFDKAVGTFIDSYIFGFARNGRIHGEFHPTRSTDDEEENEGGTTSGRFASSNPNQQNVPNRDPEIGPPVRECYVPEEGEKWLKLDWASQEPRLTIHFAALAKRRGAEEMVERFRRDPMTDLHQECAVLMNVSRKDAKAINLGLAYGMQGAKLCHTLGLPTKFITSSRGTQIEVAGEEGQRLLDLHFNRVPFIRGVFDLAKKRVNERGYVTTLSGRRIRFRKGSDGNYWRAHKALNAVIQGSAADQMKMALAAFRREGLPFLLTVHDECDASLPKGEEGTRRLKRMVEIMETVTPLLVPMVAEYKLVSNWGEAK